MKLIPVKIYVELPFWIRTPDDFQCSMPNIHDKPFTISINNNFHRLWVSEIRKDYQTNVFIGIKEYFDEKSVPVKSLWEKCRTVISFNLFEKEECKLTKAIRGKNEMELKSILQTEMMPLINDLIISKYRAITYDQSVYELNSWDLPVWHLQVDDENFLNVILVDYLSFNEIPYRWEFGKPETARPYYLSEDPKNDFNNPVISFFKPYELELLDAYNLKLRGNYKDALRRMVSSFEILLDQIIIDQMIKQGMNENEARNEVSNVIAWKKKKQLYKDVFKKELRDHLKDNLLEIVEEARGKRHKIVHQGLQIKPSEKGHIRYLIDHIRFATCVLDPEKDRVQRRENFLLTSNHESFEFFD